MAYRVGPQKIVPSPGTYSAHVECGGKFSQVWPKLHLLSMWRWKRAPIARLVSLSVIWGGPPVFQVASSQTWGRARPRGKRLPRAALLPRCDRCLTGASALDFGHPHVEWKAEHAFWAPKVTKSFLAHLEHYAAARVHSATLRENRPSHGPHGEWHHDFPRLGPNRRQEVLWRISARPLPRLWPESALCRLHFGRPLGHNQGVQES